MKDFSEFLETKDASQKVVWIVRGLPGSGKSYTTRELLQQHGGNLEKHVFSTDTLFHPLTNKLSSINSLSREDAWQLCESITNLWKNTKWSRIKADNEEAFLEFKNLVDKNKYYEALVFAKQMSNVLESIEYRENWHGSKLKDAHAENLTKFSVII